MDQVVGYRKYGPTLTDRPFKRAKFLKKVEGEIEREW
jgi:hypothetical protein